MIGKISLVMCLHFNQSYSKNLSMWDIRAIIAGAFIVGAIIVGASIARAIVVGVNFAGAIQKMQDLSKFESDLRGKF